MTTFSKVTCGTLAHFYRVRHAPSTIELAGISTPLWSPKSIHWTLVFYSMCIAVLLCVFCVCQSSIKESIYPWFQIWWYTLLSPF